MIDQTATAAGSGVNAATSFASPIPSAMPIAAPTVLSVAAFDFFHVPPYLTFAVSDTQYVVTFAVMLAVAIVISTLTARTRAHAEAEEAPASGEVAVREDPRPDEAS